MHGGEAPARGGGRGLSGGGGPEWRQYGKAQGRRTCTLASCSRRPLPRCPARLRPGPAGAGTAGARPSSETLRHWTCLVRPDLRPRCVSFLTARAQQKRAAGTVAQRRHRLPPLPSSQAALVRGSGVTTWVRPLGPRDTLEKAKCFHSSLYLYVFYKEHPTCSPVTLPTHPPFLCGQGCLSEGGAGPGPARRLDPLPSAPLCGQRGSLGQRLRPSLNPRLWPLA